MRTQAQRGVVGRRVLESVRREERETPGVAVMPSGASQAVDHFGAVQAVPTGATITVKPSDENGVVAEPPPDDITVNVKIWGTIPLTLGQAHPVLDVGGPNNVIIYRFINGKAWCIVPTFFSNQECVSP